MYEPNQDVLWWGMRETLVALIFVGFFASNVIAYQTETEYISSEEYFNTAITKIGNAKSSITMAMYLISSLPDQPDSQPNQLLNALIQAKDRGVAIKIILDQNIDFGSESLDEAVTNNKNQKAYELLKKNNIPVYFDTSDTYTHAKVLVIDNETVLLGSTNWSKAALTRNNEANALIRSKDFAKEVLDSINKIQIQENVPAILTPSVKIQKEFIESKKLLGEIATNADERTLDTYLYFLKEFDQNKENKLTLNYDHLAKSLGIDKMSTEDYRRQINKVLLKLKDKYKLINFKPAARNQNVELSLTKPKEEIFTQIPTLYWKYNWNQKLPFQAKVLYLIFLDYSESSPSGKISISREQITKDHGISESFISDGTKALRQLSLLTIQYSELENQQFDQRQPNTYTLKDLYDPDELSKKFKSMEQKYSLVKLNRAIEIAKLVFEENNPKTIEVLIEFENTYGEATVREAAKKISEKNPDNPKRSAGYLINTIKSMGKK